MSDITGRSDSDEIMATVNGELFECPCGCNVFTPTTDGIGDVLVCNACGAEYRGVREDD